MPLPSPKSTHEATRFAKFMAVGGIGFVVDAASLYLFTRGLGLTLLLGQAFSFSLAVINNFLWNRHWTFPEARGEAFHRQLTKFYVTSIAGLAIRSLSIGLLEAPLERAARQTSMLSLPPKLLSDYAALFVSIVIVSAWNYIINRLWTFRKTD